MTPYENTILQHLDRTGVDINLLTVHSHVSEPLLFEMDKHSDRRWVKVIIPTRVVKNPIVTDALEVVVTKPIIYQECQIDFEFNVIEPPTFFAGFIRGQISAKRPDILRQGWY